MVHTVMYNDIEEYKRVDYRLTQAGIFLALSLPGYFLSTRLGSRVTQPAKHFKG